MTEGIDRRSQAREWVESAHLDLIKGEVVLSRVGRTKLTEKSASGDFHLCCEKCLKSLIIFSGGEIFRSHDLIVLKLKAESLGVAVPVDSGTLEQVKNLSVAARYPGMDVSDKEFELSWRVAKILHNFVESVLNSSEIKDSNHF